MKPNNLIVPYEAVIIGPLINKYFGYPSLRVRRVKFIMEFCTAMIAYHETEQIGTKD